MNIPPCPFSNSDVDAVIQNMLKNIATTSNSLTMTNENKSITAIPGAVIAAPAMRDAKFSQCYYFHWVRDGAITIGSVCALYEKCRDPKKKAYYKEIILAYVDFVEKIQQQPELNGINILGEPKFNIDGTLWTEAWGRPQIGGINCQILVLCNIIRVLTLEGNNEKIIEKIYNSSPSSLLKANLEYCASTWKEETFNVWEELKGEHFSVALPRRFALLAGAAVASHLGDPGAAAYYTETAGHITDLLRGHWNEELGYYFETRNEENLLGGGIDSSVLMSIFYAQAHPFDKEFILTSYRSLSTIFYVRNSFESLYKINVDNKMQGVKGLLIGRYTQDIYDGNQSIYGNPWFLCTNLLAGTYYALAKQLLQGETILVNTLVQQFLLQTAPNVTFLLNDIINSKHKNFSKFIACLLEEGDAILSLIKKYCITYEDGSAMHMSEQIDRASGEQVSARDLSWSYATLISAVNEREKLLNELQWK